MKVAEYKGSVTFSLMGFMRIGMQLATVSAIWLLAVSCAKVQVDVEDQKLAVEALLADGVYLKSEGNAQPDLSQGFEASLIDAIQSHNSYIASLAAIKSKSSAVNVARAALRPQITGSSGAVATRELEGGSSGASKGVAAGINFSQLLYDGGSAVADVELANLEVFSADLQSRIVMNEVGLSASAAWLNLWKNHELRTMLVSQSETVMEFAAKAERMSGTGLVDRSQLEKIQDIIVSLDLERSVLDVELQQSEIMFSQLFGVVPKGLTKPPAIFAKDLREVKAVGLKGAPKLEVSALAVLKAKNAVSKAKAVLRPTVKLDAGVQSPVSTDSTTDASVGLVVNYTFGDGGRRKAQITVAEAELDAAEASLSDSVSTLEAEVETLVSKYNSILSSMPLLDRKIVLDQKQIETVSSQVSTGRSSFEQIVSANVQLFRTKQRKLTAEYELLMTEYTLADRLGWYSQLLAQSVNE